MFVKSYFVLDEQLKNISRAKLQQMLSAEIFFTCTNFLFQVPEVEFRFDVETT